MTEIIKSAYRGEATIGCAVLECHVLENEQRIFSRKDLLHALNLKFDPKEERKQVQLFLDRINFISIIGDQTLYKALNNPIKFRKGNFIAYGYPAELLAEVCNAMLALAENRRLPVEFEVKEVAKQSRKLLKALANVGVVALIDEATGYQNHRAKNALQSILDEFLKKEHAAWAKRFPDEFYEQMFRLKKWDWKGMKESRPGIVGTYTKDLVYNRLAPGVLQELERRNPLIAPGRRKVKHHQWLTDDIGHPALGEHLHTLISFMKISNRWDQFYRYVTKAFPVYGEQLDLDLYDE
jgi:hypothetical protein